MAVSGAHVAIIVLNYNGWENTRDCLESVMALEYAGLSLFVVDNGSRDGEAGKIDRWLSGVSESREEMGAVGLDECRAVAYTGARGSTGAEAERRRKWAFLLANGVNRGFTRGNNMAIELAFSRVDPDYVMLLNNDVVLKPDSLAILAAFARGSREIGSVQPRILRKGASGVVDSLGQAVYRNGRAKDMGQGERDPGPFGNVEIFGTCAAAALYNAGALKDAGLLDERFFIILEDVDLAWRLRLCGYTSYCVSSAVAYHNRGISGTKRFWESIDLVRSYNQNKNHLLVVLKYYPLEAIFNFLYLNIFRFAAALISGACLGRNPFAPFGGIMKERRKLRQQYPAIEAVRRRWLQ